MFDEIEIATDRFSAKKQSKIQQSIETTAF